MEGLLPFLLHAIKKQRQPANVYRCLSDNSTGRRSYHLLLAEGSSDQWTSSEFQPPPAVDLFTVGSNQLTSPERAGNGLKHRGFASGSKVKN